MNNHFTESHDFADYEKAIINSALWAASGDALGWMTELAPDKSNVKYRTGSAKVNSPTSWKRMINGRNGPQVNLPAGTYSDDTQLRLAVCRAIRGNGSFDVEAFAKVELTIWPTYALGGGLGTKIAAQNLAKRGVNWFSNFYEKNDHKYINGGGNGAAMRVQPHVWASINDSENMLLNVLRDALVTHGHPHGFCGAVLHALLLHNTIQQKKIPPLDSWKKIVDHLLEIPSLLTRDAQLSTFWLPTWEESSKVKFTEAIIQAHHEAILDLNIIHKILISNSESKYQNILEELDCKSNFYRGSGLKTALAALALSHIFEHGAIEDALILCANELNSDTDTIATMVGALLGALTKKPPQWQIQDREYLILEAKRLSKIAYNLLQDSFVYPELSQWNPPLNQTASINLTSSGFSMAGLGELVEEGEKYTFGNFIWQWFKLPFGQTILAKYKNEIEKNNTQNEGKFSRKEYFLEDKDRLIMQKDLFNDSPIIESYKVELRQNNSLDYLTDEVIKADFDDYMLGRLLNQLIDSSESIDLAVAFTSIIAKAKLARKRRKNRV